MTAASPPLHSPASRPERPKGILKNSSSYRSDPHGWPTGEGAAVVPASRPPLARDMSEKEVVIENTLRNAGPHRRSSSNPGGPGSRRQSGTGQVDENNSQLKWDEANLYFNEQNRDSTMKIDEPKTPYARQYNPVEDEAEYNVDMLNAEQLKVDELDDKPMRERKTDDIPEFDLGEPEMVARALQASESEKRVMVEEDGQTDAGYHGELLPNATQEEREKHRKFEEMRKKHYEMSNVKDLLGHPEDADEEEESEAPSAPPLPNGR